MLAVNSTGRVDAKVVIIGSADVGKTSLMRRFVYDKFTTHREQTIGATFVSKEVFRGKKSINLALWDTAGAERHWALMPHYYRKAKAAVVCFDLTDSVTWQNLKNWVSELREREPDCKIFICATKKDLVDDGLAPRNVAESNIKLYCDSLELPYVETSSKSGENVDKLFSMIADAVWDQVVNGATTSSPSFIVQPTPVRSCCRYS